MGAVFKDGQSEGLVFGDVEQHVLAFFAEDEGAFVEEKDLAAHFCPVNLHLHQAV